MASVGKVVEHIWVIGLYFYVVSKGGILGERRRGERAEKTQKKLKREKRERERERRIMGEGDAREEKKAMGGGMGWLMWWTED
jgi:hypothetical protein